MRKIILILSCISMAVGSVAFANISIKNGCNQQLSFGFSCVKKGTCTDPGYVERNLASGETAPSFPVCAPGCGIGGTLIIDVRTKPGVPAFASFSIPDKGKGKRWNDRFYTYTCDKGSPTITQS